jgi:hypothetical protein
VDEVAGLLNVTHPYKGVWAKVVCGTSFDTPLFNEKESLGGQLATIRVEFLRGFSILVR